jgi:hypothetical protein
VQGEGTDFYVKARGPYSLYLFVCLWLNGPIVGQSLLIVEASRWHSDTSHSVGLLWTSDWSVAETSTWQYTTLTTDKRPCPRRDSKPQSQKASGRWPTPQTAQPLGSVHIVYTSLNSINCYGKTKIMINCLYLKINSFFVILLRRSIYCSFFVSRWGTLASMLSTFQRLCNNLRSNWAHGRYKTWWFLIILTN